MVNNEQINAYKKTQQSSNVVTSSHEIVRTLMKELVNSMQKIVVDFKTRETEIKINFLLIKLLRKKIHAINQKI